LPADVWQSNRALAAAAITPIAVGDEVSVPSVMERLNSEAAVDAVRLDATSIGGFTTFAVQQAQAERAGLGVSPHAYGEIHQHCAFAWGGVTSIELSRPVARPGARPASWPTRWTFRPRVPRFKLPWRPDSACRSTGRKWSG